MIRFINEFLFTLTPSCLVINYSTNIGEYSVRQRLRRRYLPDNRPSEGKLDQKDVTRICQSVIDDDMDTGLVAEQFNTSRRRVQQFVKEYRDSDTIPQLETPWGKPYEEYPDNLEERILELRQRLALGPCPSYSYCCPV